MEAPAPVPAAPVAKPSRLKATLGVLLESAGPLLVFYGVDYVWGLFPAIAASTVWSVGDLIRHVVMKKPVTAIFKLTAAMTLVFGSVDLLAQQSLLFKYEATVTNLGMAVFFVATLRGGASVIEETWAANPDNSGRAMPKWLKGMFRALTLFWSAYFLLKAVAYFFLAGAFSIEKAMAIRAVAGNVSMFAMAGLTLVFARVYKRFWVSKAELDADEAEEAKAEATAP
jgi:intracellular septation protein A